MRLLLTCVLLSTSVLIRPSLAFCTIGLQKDDGLLYNSQAIAEFVEKEVRPELSRVERPFNIYLHRKCNEQEAAVTSLGMRSTDLYILSINGTNLPEDVVRYTNDSLEINAESFDRAVASAMTFSDLSKHQQQETLKLFAFVIAEAARFSDVNRVAAEAISGNCSIQWTEYARLLRSWKLISIFANSKALISGSPYVGGYRAFLIAPITDSMIEKYNDAIQQGWTIDDGEYAPADKKDPSKDLANRGGLHCPSP